ncbi:MAG TPA: transketolase C-terminal domain-containing protein, partial [Candidatus Methylomirabilis sp.]|nr:transketolase C-terminal domain-containing protein [Candidatus Methylomirabilis sp.]
LLQAYRARVEAVLLPPYAPDLNPDEWAWAHLKCRELAHHTAPDTPSLQPLDWETVLASVRKTSKLCIAHEDSMSRGIGNLIAARVAQEVFDDLDGPIVRVGAADTHVPFSPPLEEFVLPNEGKILQALRELAAY